MQEQKDKTKKSHKSATSDIVARINEAENILIALSKNPTADELAAAIGLSLFLDKAGKHATAIYSGETPNILEFLEPEQRLETNTDSLQDFIIAINKDKADHLRYKVEGDYVRVYITPYKTKISAEDLEFSHGDFNIGLVVALNVPSEESLDAALTNHGRILHDAEIINIAATASGNFGQTQWLDPTFSSVSEMIANLVFDMEAELGNDLNKETATALLTGIFVATERFSNGRTQPETMNMAAKLMSAGADQQQISAHLLLEDDDSLTKRETVKNNIQPDVVKNDFIDETPIAQESVANDIKITSSPASKTEPNDEGLNTTSDNTVADKLDFSSEEQNLANENKDEFIPRKMPTADFADEKEDGSTPQEMPTDGFELPPVIDEKIEGVDEKLSLDQMATPFEETPAPDFENMDEVSETPEQIQQPAVRGIQNTPASLGADFANGENATVGLNTISNPINNFEQGLNTAPTSISTPANNSASAPSLSATSESKTGMLGKDYGALMDEAIKADEQQPPQQPQHGFIGSNPALMAAPGVADAPEENNVPGMDFSNPVEMTDDEKPAGAAQNDIGVLGRDYSTDVQPLAPSQVANSAPHLAPLPHPDSVSSVPEQNNSVQEAMVAPTQMMVPEPKPVGMPLPGEEILPPPPTPPVDFGAVQTTQLGNEPVLPSVDDSIFNNSVVVQPDSLVNQQPQFQAQSIAQSQPVAQPQPISPVNNDPSAFHIPGM